MVQTITPPADSDQNDTLDNQFDENPELFGGDEYESDAYAPDPQVDDETDENYGDFDDDDLRSN